MAKKSSSARKSASDGKAPANKRTGAANKAASAAKHTTHRGLHIEATLGEVKLRSASGKKPVEVVHLTEAPTFTKPRRIHPRRYLPFIAEGEDITLPTTTRAFAPQEKVEEAAAAADPGDNITLVRNTTLDSPGQQDTASNVGEPSVAANDKVVVYTGNWYAAVSSDGGNTFQFIDPAEAFKKQDPPNSHFCCDQIVHYISKIDTFVWLLQYGPDSGDNIQRLAFAKTADVVQGRWRLFDITTKSLGVQGSFMDFPDLAVGANMLYVTTNIFPPGKRAGAAVVRIPLSGIESGQITAESFVTMQIDSLRVAQNCDKTAFFAGHVNTSTLRVFSWKEGVSAPTSKALKVTRWEGTNGYLSRTPDGRRWLDRADPRITGATMKDKEVWFAWGVDRGGANQHPNPFVQIARIDSTKMAVLENINIFDVNSAICYPALSTNANGEVGISYMIGGGDKFPTHVVGILTNPRRDFVTAKGDRSPLADPDTGKNEWGDYLTVRRFFPNQKLFVASGYTMQGGGDGSNRDVTPRFIIFGRSRDVS